MAGRGADGATRPPPWRTGTLSIGAEPPPPVLTRGHRTERHMECIDCGYLEPGRVHVAVTALFRSFKRFGAMPPTDRFRSPICLVPPVEGPADDPAPACREMCCPKSRSRDGYEANPSQLLPSARSDSRGYQRVDFPAVESQPGVQDLPRISSHQGRRLGWLPLSSRKL
jgi:hypothetical protein